MTTPKVGYPGGVGEPRRFLAEARNRRYELVCRGRWKEADDLVERALGEALGRAEELTGPDLADLAYVPGAGIFGSQGQEDRLPYSTVEARTIAVHSLLLANRGMNRAEAVRQANRVLSSAGRHDIAAFWAAVVTLIHADELSSAHSACERAGATSLWSRSAGHRDVVALLRGRISGAWGKTAKAAAVFGRFLERGTSPRLTGVAAAWLAETLSELGDQRGAYLVLHENGFDGTGMGHPERTQLLAARSAVHLAAANFQLGLEDALACGESVSAWAVHNPAVVPWRSRAALCAAALGRSDLAVVLAQQEYELANRWGTARARGIALHALGVAQRDGGSVELLFEAEALLSDSTDAFETSRVRYDLGCLLVSSGRQEEAKEFLSAAAGAGTQVWSAYAATTVERISAGRRMPPLTCQETSVAKLALAGRTNKEVALSLHLTARTVEFHLSNVYRKLGISGRDELVVAALLIG